jgi:hypothetical protein
MAPFASPWLGQAELRPALVDRLCADDASRRAAHSLLIAGLYEDFKADLLWPVLCAAARRPNVRLTFLIGRDAPSLAWFTAKQYVRTAPDVAELGLFTSTDRGLTRSGIHLRDGPAMETADIKSEMLGTRWRRLLLQGHGADDLLHLADFTVCGLNEVAHRDPALVSPVCAFGPTCFKPIDKVIQLREVRAAEVILSSCNNAPFVDAALYDPKYQLMLNAIDGTARDVVAAFSVHDSDHAENRAWMEAALADGSSVAALNASISTTQPVPPYIHFGMGDDEDVTPETEPLQVVPEPLLLTTSARLTAYLAGGLLSPTNPLRSRLGKLAGKVENQISRRSLAAQDRAATIRSLLDDLQSLDHAIATQFVKDPDNDFSNCAAYFGSRSRLDLSSLTHVRCHCGRPAERYIRRALVPTALDTEGVICLRCGDVEYRLPDAPSLLLHADENVHPGGTLQVRAVVRGARPGAMRVGLFIAHFARTKCTITPDRQKVRIGASGDGEVEFTLTLAPDTRPMAYYMAGYGVQDLAVTMARRHFGVLPASAGMS